MKRSREEDRLLPDSPVITLEYKNLPAESRDALVKAMQKFSVWHAGKFPQGYRPPEVFSGSVQFEPFTTASLPPTSLPVLDDRPAPPAVLPSKTMWFNVKYESSGDVPTYTRALDYPLGKRTTSGNNHRGPRLILPAPGADATAGEGGSLPGPVIASQQQHAKRMRISQRCFNCGSYSHSMRECHKAHNAATIEAARAEMRGSSSSSTPSQRYFAALAEDMEEEATAKEEENGGGGGGGELEEAQQHQKEVEEGECMEEREETVDEGPVADFVGFAAAKLASPPPPPPQQQTLEGQMLDVREERGWTEPYFQGSREREREAQVPVLPAVIGREQERETLEKGGPRTGRLLGLHGRPGMGPRPPTAAAPLPVSKAFGSYLAKPVASAATEPQPALPPQPPDISTVGALQGVYNTYGQPPSAPQQQQQYAAPGAAPPPPMPPQHWYQQQQQQQQPPAPPPQQHPPPQQYAAVEPAQSYYGSWGTQQAPPPLQQQPQQQWAPPPPQGYSQQQYVYQQPQPDYSGQYATAPQYQQHPAPAYPPPPQQEQQPPAGAPPPLMDYSSVPQQTYAPYDPVGVAAAPAAAPPPQQQQQYDYGSPPPPPPAWQQQPQWPQPPPPY